MVTKSDVDSMVEWLLGNYAYGHLDEMPDAMLIAFIRDRQVSQYLACLFCQVGMTKTDNVEELMAAYRELNADVVTKAQHRVRAWIIAERLRRMGKLRIDEDVLIKELASLECCGAIFMPDGSLLTARIVEVLPGVVTMVGQEINLCQ